MSFVLCSLHQAHGFSLLQYVAAVLSGRCQEAVTPMGSASADLSLRGHGVSSAALGTTPTLTAMVRALTFSHLLRNMPIFARFGVFQNQNLHGLD